MLCNAKQYYVCYAELRYTTLYHAAYPLLYRLTLTIALTAILHFSPVPDQTQLSALVRALLVATSTISAAISTYCVSFNIFSPECFPQSGLQNGKLNQKQFTHMYSCILR